MTTATKKPITTLMRPKFWAMLGKEAAAQGTSRAQLLDQMMQKRFAPKVEKKSKKK